MRVDETPSSPDGELAALGDRLRAAQRDAAAAMTAIGVIGTLLALLRGWAVV
ncbi:MAG TPA: hypothetical protein VLA59_09170 [Patescibacteria group bacterium]|nr:hypothetical protein [Patescibacteria group bacterium]